jgi:hypothetical protein
MTVKCGQYSSQAYQGQYHWSFEQVSQIICSPSILTAEKAGAWLKAVIRTQNCSRTRWAPFKRHERESIMTRFVRFYNDLLLISLYIIPLSPTSDRAILGFHMFFGKHVVMVFLVESNFVLFDGY